MKKLNLTIRTALHLAASATLALVAMVAPAHAQTYISHVVELRTGNDSTGAPLLIGADDGTITHSQSSGCSTSPNARLNAMNGLPAKVVQPAQAWIQALSDQDARWIHSDHTPSGIVGTGLPSGSVQYAHRFDLPLDMPSDAKVLVEMEIAADDMVGAVSFGPDASTVLSSVYFAGGGYSSATFSTFPGTPTNLGLVPGVNHLFVKQCDTSANFSGLIYSFKITIEYCVVEIDLRSGVTEGAAGLVDLQPGDPDLDVRCYGNYGLGYQVLSVGGGSAPFRVLPHVSWVAGLSDTAGWIHITDSGETGSYGSGRPPQAVMYAHDFLLPSIPSDATVTLDLEWAADETLFGVSINQDIATAGGQLQIGSSATQEFSSAQLAQVSGTVQSLGLVGGQVNSLYLSTLENYPGSVAQNTYNYISSGIIYIAKLKITFRCDDVGTPSTAFESFCDCTIALDAPCGNVGGPDQGCANSSGSGASITSSGLAVTQSSQSSSLINTFTLHANNLPTGGVFGIFIEGSNTLSPIPLGDGLRCIGHIRRLQIVFTSTGEVSYSPTGNKIPMSPGTKYYQFWYRDTPMLSSPCQKGFNLTNAIGVDWL